MLIFASTAFLLWPLRTILKIILSNLHLETDADERVTMAMAYLAILRSDQDFPEPERKIILDALFRSAATGIVKDEGIPTSVVDTIARTFRG